MGAAALISMGMMPSFQTGIKADLRTPLVAISALFGGVPTALISSLMSGGYRIYLGGVGVVGGLTGIVSAAAAGLVMRWWCANRDLNFRELVFFAIFATAASNLSFLVLPSDLAMHLMRELGPPLALTKFIATLLMGLLLKRSERRRKVMHENVIFRSMVKHLPDCLNFKDAEGRFVAANPATAQLMGASSEHDLITRSDTDFYPLAAAMRYREEELAVIRDQKPARFLQEFINPDGGQRWLSTLKAPVYGRWGELLGIITHNRDVTDEIRMAKSKSEFISLVSHELRTPLTSIRGALGLLVGGMVHDLPEKTQSLIKIAHNNSERLIFLVNDILDMEKVESGKMEFTIAPTELRPLIEQVVEGNASYMHEKAIQTIIEDEVPGANAMVDAQRLQQVCLNLLSNAMKFSPENSTITIRITAQRRFLRIAVSDEGPGISEEFRKRIFQKFERSNMADNRSIGGTGLGLNIAKSITENMGGQIGFECHDDRPGTTFFVDLVPASGLGGAAITVGDEAKATPRLRLLHIEDDENARDGVAEVLSANYDLTSVGALDEARSVLSKSVFDLVILDVWLPDGSGLEIIEHVPVRTPLLILSDCPLDPANFKRPITIGRKSQIPLSDIPALVEKALDVQGPQSTILKPPSWRSRMLSRR
ncbi:ATP-binding protein [Jiella sp. MQZ9-1]|nr:ATP-binding protein [Jiella flava]